MVSTEYGFMLKILAVYEICIILELDWAKKHLIF